MWRAGSFRARRRSEATSATTLQIRGGGAVVFEDQPLRDGGLYNWTIQALDEGMRVVGVSREPTAFFVNLPDLP